MSAIYQRLRHSFRRRPRQPLREQPAAVPSSLREERHTPDLSDDEDEARDDERSSPPPLPVISDRGPPTSNRYGRSGLFWNSVMHEAEKHDKSWLSPSRPGTLHPDDEYTGRSRLPRHGFTRDVPPPKQPGDAQERTSKLSARAAAVRRNMDTSYANRNAPRNVIYGRERADNDLTVMYYAGPGDSYTPSRPSYRQSPSIPTSSHVDHRPDFESKSQAPAHLVEPQQPEPPTEKPASTLSPLAIVQEDASPDILHAYRMPNPSSLSFSDTSPTALAWSRALSQIMRNDFVDPNMKQRVRERVNGSKTTNGDGDGEGERFHVAPIEAGLVPNFSYPVAGSAFYDRQVTDATTKPGPNDQVIEDKVGEESKAQEPQPLTDIQKQDFDFGFGPNEPNGVMSHSFSSLPTYISSLSNESTSPTTLPSREPSYSDSNVFNRLNTLLTETLSASQLNLLTAILAIPPNTPASASTTLRLTHSLHALLLHLQDRTLYSEEDLFPRLGAALEHKAHTIDVLSLGTEHLGDQITQLKATVDFSSKILSGCFTRDWEMWSTLNGIREGRRRGWWDFRRSRVPEGRDSGQRFSSRELDALVMIAEQNVGVLREDVDDLVEKVEGCKRAFVARQDGEGEVEPEEGSWRDV